MKYHVLQQLLFVVHIWLSSALPIVDPGLFVIMGVNTCRSGEGYCLLGLDCTLDEDFLPDDLEGHCDGLRSAFTPSAHFICCKYNDVNATTVAPTDVSTTTEDFSPVSLVTPFTPDRPADGALVNILKDYLDTNEEPLIPIKPELVANNHLPTIHDDIEVIAEPIESNDEKGPSKDQPINIEEILKISEPIDIDKNTDIPQNTRPTVNGQRIHVPEMIKTEQTGKIKDVKDVFMLTSIDDDRMFDKEKLVEISTSDVLKMDTQRPIVRPPSKAPLGGTKHEVYGKRPDTINTQPVVKGQISRVNSQSQHNYNDRDIQEATLETMIPVKIVDVNNHGSKNVNIRRTSGSPAVMVTIANVSPHLEQINLIPRSLWK